MSAPPRIIRVAVPSPMRRLFDYLPPRGITADQLRVGMRVSISFGKRRCVGVVLETTADTTFDAARLKPISEVIDASPILPPVLVVLASWAAEYYQHPIGDVIQSVLPVLLRQGKSPDGVSESVWCLTAAGQQVESASLTRAPRQAALLVLLQQHPHGLAGPAIEDLQPGSRPILQVMAQKGWAEQRRRTVQLDRPADGAEIAGPEIPRLNPAQQEAVTCAAEGLGKFGVYLLEGVTGSGKTEVYLSLVARVLARGEQALVLVPEIGLTPQLIERFRRRFNAPLAVLHSGLTDRERLAAWMAARDGQAGIILGTRSAVFTPLARPGLMILDEEHDLSFKQQEGFRYSARDVCVKRAQLEKVPVVLGSATPSLESLYNVQQGRYQLLRLPERAGTARHPQMQVLDMRKQPVVDGLSAALLNSMQRHLQQGGQVMLFLNRRGYAPALLCHDCGWVAPCRRCDALLTLYTVRGQRQLRCQHCGSERPVDVACPACASTQLRAVGAGTERIEETLEREFKGVSIARIDRDTTRRKGALQALLDSVHDGSSRILVGTQMLAKGHHFPEVTLVALVDVDQGLFSSDFRGTERLAQLVIQVAGRAGRADKPGQVLIQTHHPDHPLLQRLLVEGYAAFAAAALDERRLAQLPPYSYLALLRAEAVEPALPMQFLTRARELAQTLGAGRVTLLGPVPAPMERRAGRIRAQLMFQAGSRGALHRLLTPLLTQLESERLGRKVRWSIDVDPQETY